MTIFYFLIMLGLLIAIHEAGHMLVAKACGMYVREYAIGFGPKLFSKKGKETTYTLRAIPLGGFTALIENETDNIDREAIIKAFVEHTKFNENEIRKLLTNVNFDIEQALKVIPENDETFDEESINTIKELTKFDPQNSFVSEDRTFYGAHPLKRIAVLAAGPLFNIILAFLIFIGIFINIGQVAIYPDPIIGKVHENTPAFEAGLLVNDKIIEMKFANGDVINPETTYDVSLGMDLHSAQTIDVTVLRNGELVTINIEPVYNEEAKSYMMGITFAGEVTYKKIGLGQSIIEGAKYTIQFVDLTFKSLIQLFTGKAGLENVSGTIGIYTYTKEAVEYGFVSYLSLVGSISISLALMNLVPVPVFDGGRIVMTIMEMIIGHRLNKKFENTLLYIGLIFMIGLFVLVTFLDVTRLFK